MKKATFTKMTQGTQEDYVPIVEAAMVHSENLPERIIEHLNMLKDDFGGFAVDRYEHCLQTASRAYRDGRDEEYVVCALLHDIGDILAPANHADFAATLLEPYISEKNYWIFKHHGIFQGYYFFHFLGLDRHMRDKFKDSEHWKDCVEFCANTIKTHLIQSMRVFLLKLLCRCLKTSYLRLKNQFIKLKPS